MTSMTTVTTVTVVDMRRLAVIAVSGGRRRKGWRDAPFDWGRA